MPANATLNLLEVNTDSVVLNITLQTGGDAFDLTGSTLEFFFKPTASTADNDVSVTKLVSPTDITITDAAQGIATFTVPAGVVATPGTRFYRCDVVTGSIRRTALYGDVVVQNV